MTRRRRLHKTCVAHGRCTNNKGHTTAVLWLLRLLLRTHDRRFGRNGFRAPADPKEKRNDIHALFLCVRSLSRIVRLFLKYDRGSDG